MSTSIGELEGTISLEDRFSHALELVGVTTEKVFSEMEGWMGTAALAAGAVVGAVAGITGTIVALGVQGSHLNDLDASFERLAGGVENAKDIMAAMNRGVADTVDSTKLLEFANKALSTGAIKTAADFGTVTTAARVLSRQGFGPVEQQLGAIQQALTTGRVRQLQYTLGVIDLKAAEEKYAKSLGITRDQLSAQGKLHADQIAIYERLNQKVAEAGVQQKSFAEKITTVRLSISNWFDDIAKSVAKSTAVNAAFDAIGEAITRNFGGGDAIKEGIIRWIDRFANAAATLGPQIIAWLKETWDGVIRLAGAVKDAWDLVPDWFKTIAKEAALTAGAIGLANMAVNELTGASVITNLASFATMYTAWGGAVRGTALALKELAQAVLAFGAVETAIAWFPNLAARIALIPAVLQSVGSIFVEFGAILFDLSNPIGWVIGALTALTVGLRYLTGSWDFVMKPLIAFKDAILDLPGTIRAVSTTMAEWVSSAITKLSNALDYLATTSIGRILVAITEITVKLAGWTVIKTVTAAWKIFNDILADAKTLLGWVADAATMLWKIIGAPYVERLMEDFRELGVTIDKYVMPILNFLGEKIQWLFDKIAKGFEWINDHIPDLPFADKLPKVLEAPRSVPVPLPVITAPPIVTTPPTVGRPGGGNPLGDIQEDAKKFADATKASIERTRKLWDDYFTSVDAGSTDELSKELNKIERWKAGLQAALDESKATNKNYYNEVAALEATYWQKREDAELSFIAAEKNLDASRKEGVESATAIGKALAGQPDILKNMATATAQFTDEMNNAKGATHDLEHGSLLASHAIEGVSKQGTLVGATFNDIDKKIAAALSHAQHDTVTLTNAVKAQIREWVRLGVSVEDIAEKVGVSVQAVEHALNTGFAAVGKNLEKIFADLPQTLMRAFEGGGDFVGAFKSLGVQIADAIITPLMDGLSKAAKYAVSIGASIASTIGSKFGQYASLIGGTTSTIAGAAIATTAWGASMAATTTGAIVLGVATLGIGVAAVGTYVLLRKLFGGDPVVKEINKVRQAFIDQAGGLHALSLAAVEATGSLTLVNALLDAKTAESYNAALIAITETLERMAEIDAAISGLGIKSAEALQHAADIARLAYEKVRDGVLTGKFTAADAVKAYRAYQEAIAAMGGAAGAAAQAWLDAQEAAKSGAKAVDAALQAMITRRDELSKGIEMEMPEPDMGKIEEAMRKERDALDAVIKATQEAQARATEEAAKAAADAAGESADGASSATKEKWGRAGDEMSIDMTQAMLETAQATEQHFNDAAHTVQSDLIGAAAAAARGMQSEFDDVEVHVKVFFDQQGMPGGPGGSGAGGAGTGGTQGIQFAPLATGAAIPVTSPRATTPRQASQASVTEIHQHNYIDNREQLPVLVTAIMRDDHGVATIIKRKVLGK